MTRHFTIRKMLRMTPNRLLQDFFRRLGQQLLSVDWRRMPERCDEALMISVNLLPRDAHDEMEAALSAIHELACEAGVQTILEASKLSSRSDFVSLLPQAGPYHIAMWTWLHFPSVFDQAALMQSVDTLSRWRKRKDLPRVEPRSSTEASNELACAISRFLRCEEGRGHHCTVEHYRRRGGTDFYVAYPDDFMQTIATHDESGNLQPHAIRQTFEIVFAYNREDGTLELFAKMPTRMKVKLESLFGQIILGEDIGPQRYARPYDLNRLKDRYFCLETDPEDGLMATIPWRNEGQLRGGTTYVERDGLLFAFPHSTQRKRRQGEYAMAAVAIEARPPFRVVGLTPTPIYLPERAIKFSGGWTLKVVFPMGAVLRGNEWVVSAGLNDSDVRLLRFSHDDLIAHMEF